MNYKEIPKVELHCHQEACFRPPTVMGVGEGPGLDIRTVPERFYREKLLSGPLRHFDVVLKHFADFQIRGFV